VTPAELQRLVGEMSALCFGADLTTPRVEIGVPPNCRTPGAMAWATGGDLIRIAPWTMRLDYTPIRDAVVHELIHVWCSQWDLPDRDHGEYFARQAARISPLIGVRYDAAMVRYWPEFRLPEPEPEPEPDEQTLRRKLADLRRRFAAMEGAEP
jgi:hypothetical protein